MTTEEGHFRNIEKRLRKVLPKKYEYILDMTLTFTKSKVIEDSERYTFYLLIPALGIEMDFHSRKALVSYLDKHITDFYTQPRRYQ